MADVRAQMLERPSSDTQRVRPWMLALGFPCLETVLERTSSTHACRPESVVGSFLPRYRKAISAKI